MIGLNAGGIVDLDFARILGMIAAFFRAENYPFGLIGAFGLHAYGLSRATHDLDFATDAAAQDKLIDFIESLGYKTLHRPAGYSTHCHPDESLGRLDFVYVSGDTSRRLFGEMAGKLKIGGLEVPVPRPEHLAAMKIQAIKNDPSRKLQDLADIGFLLSLPGVDEAEIRAYFEKCGLLSLYEHIKRKI